MVPSRRDFLKQLGAAFAAATVWLPASKILAKQPLSGVEEPIEDLVLDFRNSPRVRVTLSGHKRVKILVPPGAGGMHNMMAAIKVEPGATVARWPDNVLWPNGDAPVFVRGDDGEDAFTTGQSGGPPDLGGNATTMLIATAFDGTNHYACASFYE